jgi:hypothetical protein
MCSATSAACLSKASKLTGLAWYVYQIARVTPELTLTQESKLFDVANSLADVMIIMPSMNHESHFGIGPRDLIHNLSQVLSNFRGGNPAVLSILQDKLTTLGMAVGSPQKLLELSSPEEEHETWHDRSMSAPSSYSPYSDVSPTSPALPTRMSMDRDY